MITIERDRREAPRVSITRPCKIYRPRNQKYYAGMTSDLSSGGACIRISHPVECEVGEKIFLGIAQKRRQALLRSHEMMAAEIVRILPISNQETILGLRLADLSLEAAETLPLAA